MDGPDFAFVDCSPEERKETLATTNLFKFCFISGFALVSLLIER